MERELYNFGLNYGDYVWLLIFLVLGLVFGAASRACFRYPQKGIKEYVAGSITGVIAAGALLTFLGVIFGSLVLYQEYKELVQRGEVSQVVGMVEHYDPMPFTGHQEETFEIDGVKFSYSNYSGTFFGYKCAASHGGVVTHNGQHLKIQYLGTEEGHYVITYIAEILPKEKISSKAAD